MAKEKIDIDMGQSQNWSGLKQKVEDAGGYPLVAFELDHEKNIAGQGTAITDFKQFEKYVLAVAGKPPSKRVFRLVAAQQQKADAAPAS